MRKDIALPTAASPTVSAPNAPALPPLPAGVSELRFTDFFKLPVGPRGLEPTDTLRALDGKRVRLSGHMVLERADDDHDGPADAAPVPDRFLFTALPATVSFAHYGLAEDLPPQVVFVRVAVKTGRPVPYMAGSLLVTGTLSVGPQTEPDGRVSVVRLALDPAPPAVAPSPTLSVPFNQPNPSAP